MLRFELLGLVRGGALLLLLASVFADFDCTPMNATIGFPMYMGAHIHNVMVDRENKIFMDWTPKAACSRAVAMFFEHMDYHFGKDYHWPHARRKHYYERCGQASPSMLTDNAWYRFKVVRNPFTRLPSSYHHYMINYHTTSLSKEEADKTTFADFVKKIIEEDSAGNHAGLQAKQFEIAAATKGQPSPFHKIIKVENPQADLDEINKIFLAKNPSFRPFVFHNPRYHDGHEVDKHEDVTHFVGNQPWKEHANSIPANYVYYYDKELRELTQKYFHWDFELYNYTWPF